MIGHYELRCGESHADNNARAYFYPISYKPFENYYNPKKKNYDSGNNYGMSKAVSKSRCKSKSNSPLCLN